MSAREDILGRVRRGLAKADFAERRMAALASLAAPERGPQPVIGSDLVDRFRKRAESLSSSVVSVSGLADVAQAVAHYLAENGLPFEAVATADIAGLDWSSAGLTVAERSAVDVDKVGISGCFSAIAETGTLMLLSGPDTPATVSLLPETHIALVRMSQIVATMEDAFSLMRATHGGIPRAVNFVSGPSRTGDIKQTIVLGAHGPCRVHLILIGECV